MKLPGNKGADQVWAPICGYLFICVKGYEANEYSWETCFCYIAKSIKAISLEGLNDLGI